MIHVVSELEGRSKTFATFAANMRDTAALHLMHLTRVLGQVGRLAKQAVAKRATERLSTGVHVEMGGKMVLKLEKLAAAWTAVRPQRIKSC